MSVFLWAPDVFHKMTASFLMEERCGFGQFKAYFLLRKIRSTDSFADIVTFGNIVFLMWLYQELGGLRRTDTVYFKSLNRKHVFNFQRITLIPLTTL